MGLLPYAVFTEACDSRADAVRLARMWREIPECLAAVVLRQGNAYQARAYVAAEHVPEGTAQWGHVGLLPQDTVIADGIHYCPANILREVS